MHAWPRRVGELGTVRTAGVLVSLWSATAFAAEETAPPDPVTVYGGGPVQPCGWPSAVSIQGSCTGTLLHPQVVVFAAHCGASYSQIHFGDTTDGFGKTIDTLSCQIYPNGGPGTGRDAAFCVLAEPVTDVQIVPPLMGCETSVLTMGREVTLVGYGEADNGPYGIKREAVTTLKFIDGNDEAFIGGGGIDTCQGDSGGPVFVKLPADAGGDDTWRVFGITSYGNACGQGGYYSMIHTVIDWIESESGFDVTPCHDADGTWAPGPGCGMFPLAPGTAGGSWTDGCDPGELGGYSGVCGAAFDPGSDADAPTAAITAPGDGQRFDSDPPGSQVDVTIEASAQDVGYGVASVELLIDGASFDGGVRTMEPWRWNASFPKGSYVLSVRATDVVGNVGESAPVSIGIDEDATPLPAASTGAVDSSGGDGEATAAASTSDGDDAGASTGAARQDDGSDGGCGCRVERRGPWWWLLLAALPLRRRRR